MRGGFSSRFVLCSVVACAVAGAALILSTGCSVKPPPPKLTRYQNLPGRENLPAFMHDTIYERAELMRNDALLVSGFGVVSGLDATGDSVAPTTVREYIIKQMRVHGVSDTRLPGQRGITPEMYLSDPSFAIVEAGGFMPPGIRKGQPFDINVAALRESATTSVAGGNLWRTDLRIRGADPRDPGGSVNVYARSEGPLFVNPAYALQRQPSDANAKRSLRFGIVMDGGRSEEDRPLGLRLLQPQYSMSRQIEHRIDTRFQKIADRLKPNNTPGLAEAQDEGVVNFYVPASYDGDWEHFAGVVTHLYLHDSPEYATTKSLELADEAVKPDAKLMDISYCWEALGSPALAVIRDRDLMMHKSPDVAFAAARAAAFLGDPTAPMVLAQMARTDDHPFQLNAIRTLSSLANSPLINEQIRPLLDNDKTTVRLEAYRLLARNEDHSIFSRPIQNRFRLDIVPCRGTPIIYATRSGGPRIVIFGRGTSIDMPATFSLMEGRLTISSDQANNAINIFYRPPPLGKGKIIRDPVRTASRPDVAELIARLGGEGFEDSRKGLNFDYSQIVAIMNALADTKKLVAMNNGTAVPASFMLQALPQVQDSIYGAPAIPDQARPQGDETGKQVGLAK